MHSSAFGAAARMVFRSFSSAARLSSLKAARYSSMVLGLVFAECIRVGLLFVFQPAALHLFSAGGKPLPKFVHFRLRPAVHDKRYGFSEFEVRTAVERHESLSLKLEFNGHDRSLRSSGDLFSFFAIAGNFPDPGILEDGGVELHCLLGMVIEPKEWSDSLHMVFLYGSVFQGAQGNS